MNGLNSPLTLWMSKYGWFKCPLTLWKSTVNSALVTETGVCEKCSRASLTGKWRKPEMDLVGGCPKTPFPRTDFLQTFLPITLGRRQFLNSIERVLSSLFTYPLQGQPSWSQISWAFLSRSKVQYFFGQFRLQSSKRTSKNLQWKQVSSLSTTVFKSTVLLSCFQRDARCPTTYYKCSSCLCSMHNWTWHQLFRHEGKVWSRDKRLLWNANSLAFAENWTTKFKFKFITS